MDLTKIAKDRIGILGEGEYKIGLSAVIEHIETAEEHLTRGLTGGQYTAFTDTIYRTNQAFEGTIKEAYRVLTNRNPTKVKPYYIEKYLIENEILRPRVIAQLKTYRTEWRNPSTHDYKLDFDSNEALLAIANVCAFAVVLLDQMIETVARMESKKKAEKRKHEILIEMETVRSDLASQVVQAARSHLLLPIMGDAKFPTSESEVVGSLAGFIEAVVPDVNIELQKQLPNAGGLVADMIVARHECQVIVEVRLHVNSQAYLTTLISKYDELASSYGIENVVIVSEIDATSVTVSDLQGELGTRISIVGNKSYELEKQRNGDAE